MIIFRIHYLPAVTLPVTEIAMKLLRLLLLSFTLLTPSTVFSAEPVAKPKTVKLLCIGNSFSNNATKYLNDIVNSSGNELVVKSASVGGASMLTHWGKIEANEADPKDVKGQYAGGKGLKEMLASEKWDFVTIQQASFQSHDIKNYRPYGKQLKAYVAKHAPGAELLLHETWAYRVDDPRFAATATMEPKSNKAMYEMLAAAYAETAKDLHARIIPVGDAFWLADSDPKWGYRVDEKFDVRKAVAPAVPDQKNSLHVGWRWMKPAGAGEAALKIDGHHASAAGEYLGGLVVFETLYGQSCVGNKYHPMSISDEYATFLQETAHRAVEKVRAAQKKE